MPSDDSQFEGWKCPTCGDYKDKEHPCPPPKIKKLCIYKCPNHG